ncbi:MAG: lysophospholipid acyltransferase family protein [Verrucomicrobiota bacterium]
MKKWQYDCAPDLDQSLVERLRHFPRQPDMLVYGLRSIAAVIIRAWLRSYHRLEIIGRDHLPAEGSYVMVANHSSHLDTLCLLSALPIAKLHRAFPAAAADYFFQSVYRTFVAAVIVNALPFARQVKIRQSLSLCQRLLENTGNILIVFPEGTRSASGQIEKFKPGVGALVANRNVAVLPCYLDGAWRALPKGSVWPRPRKVRLIIGAPRNYASVVNGRDSAGTVAAELQETVRSLGQQYGAN